MTRKFTIDGDAIRQLADILVETDLSEIEYEDDGRRVRVARTTATSVMTMPAVHATPTQSLPTVPSEVPSAVIATDPAMHPGAVKSPMVGMAYLASEPGAAPFVSVGDMVSVGQTLLIIEAMKVMNPIKAPRAGKITHVMVKDGTPIEFSEPLMVIE